MYSNQDKLIEALVENNLIDRSQANDVKKRSLDQSKSPEEIILGDRLVDEDKMLEVKSALLNIPTVDLRGKEIPKKTLNFIPKEVAENYQMVPFDLTEKEISVGFLDPQNFKAIEAVEFLAQKAKLEAKYYLISKTSLQAGLRQYRALGEEAQEALASITEQSTSALGEKDLKEMEEVIKSAPVSKMVLVILRHALDGRSSDIHIEPTLKDTKVRYRIDGILRTSLVLPKYVHSAIVSRIKVLANLKLDESRKPQDGRIRLNIEGREIDFRVSTLPLFEGEKVVLRILDSTAKIPSLDDLGYEPFQIDIIKESIKKPFGLILMTGPTGSGKTTTLYTILSMLNKDGVNIVTLEDPIEYYMNGINQSQVNPEIKYTFASGLRAILRQDPNIVMVGEIRDTETTKLVIHAGLTGHLILSTLHTNDSLGAIPRMVDLGAEAFLLSSTINLIIAQRLARKICPDCKQEAEVPQALRDKIKSQISDIPSKYLQGIDVSKMKFYKGKGCSRCGQLGYQGRTAIAEMINITEELRNIINAGGKTSEIEKVLPKQHFITLAQSGLLKALRGETTLDEVVRISPL